ncbi:aldo/keto reductase [Microbacterium sp. BF1]|uniref:aldo/keto reductase n=1 Tax=Microbacterium sp. BF1 TaxID=2821146 RepID=UPI002119CEDB|nr:aldo/keto reductase [Microbacterium sp. BF1]
MRIDDKDDAHIRTLYETARTAGIDFFDHADIYGGSMHHCEARFADALQLTSSERDEIVLQTKCGIVPSQGMFDFSYAHIVAQVDAMPASTRAIQTVIG